MNEREKNYYRGEISRLKSLKSKCRIDDYDLRARWQVQIDELEAKVKEIPWFTDLSSEELEAERRRLDKSAFGTVATLFPGRAAYAYEKMKKIGEILDARRLEEKKKQEEKFESEIFSRSDFVKETGSKPAAVQEEIDEEFFSELTEYTVKVLQEVYRHGMDYDQVKRAYGERVVPVILSGSANEETYRSFEYYSKGDAVYRVFEGGTKYTGEEYDSIRLEKDYHNLISDTKYQKHLCILNMSIEELAELFISRSLIDPKYVTGNTRTCVFRRRLTEAYRSRKTNVNAMYRMQEMIKNYLLGNISLSETEYD